MSTLRTNNITDISGGSSSLQIGGGPPARMAQATAQASTSGTAIDFTGIPSWAKRVTVMFDQVSTNGTGSIIVQLGTSAGVQTSGYSCVAWISNTSNASHTTGFAASSVGNSGYVLSGSMIISLQVSSTGTWTQFGGFSDPSTLFVTSTSGSKTLSGTLDRIRLTTVGGTTAFDFGTINIMYEG